MYGKIGVNCKSCQQNYHLQLIRFWTRKLLLTYNRNTYFRRASIDLRHHLLGEWGSNITGKSMKKGSKIVVSWGRVERGVKKSEKPGDVIYGRPFGNLWWKGSFFSHLKGSIFYFNNQPPARANVRPESTSSSGLTF